MEHELLTAFESFLGAAHPDTRRLKAAASDHRSAMDRLTNPPDSISGLARAVANNIDGEWDIRNDVLIRTRVHGDLLDHALGYLTDESVPAAVPAALAGVILERHLVGLMAHLGHQIAAGIGHALQGITPLQGLFQKAPAQFQHRLELGVFGRPQTGTRAKTALIRL